MQNEEILQYNMQNNDETKKAQVMPALVAVFGFLALIFLVSTIALAVTRPVTENAAETEPVTTSATAEVLRFSPDKIENQIEGEPYKFGPIVRNADGHQVLTVFVNAAKPYAILDVNWEFAASYYEANSTRVDQESFKISMEKSVADILIGRASNNKFDDVLLMLLTDGRIVYMPVRESLARYNFKVYGEIEGVSDAVKFYKVHEEINGELIETVMVQKADGSIIDLRTQLLKIVGKDIK
jgi:hypothetical protein